MTEPRRSDLPADTAEVPERDRDARIEQLLVSGLDHYFNGQHELAINVWTRVLFLDRGHARARAYIERARSAVSERQREGEELIHAGAAAFQRGDPHAARRLLTSALERGAATEEVFALMERLDRLEAAGVQGDGAHGLMTAPAVRRTQPLPPTHSRTRLRWIGAGVLLGMCAAVALMLWARGESPSARPSEGAAASVPRVEEPLPVPAPAEIRIERARTLFESGRLREALPLLDEVRPGEPMSGQADELRARIQRQLLESRGGPPRRGGGSRP